MDNSKPLPNLLLDALGGGKKPKKEKILKKRRSRSQSSSSDRSSLSFNEDDAPPMNSMFYSKPKVAIEVRKSRVDVHEEETAKNAVTIVGAPSSKSQFIIQELSKEGPISSTHMGPPDANWFVVSFLFPESMERACLLDGKMFESWVLCVKKGDIFGVLKGSPKKSPTKPKNQLRLVKEDFNTPKIKKAPLNEEDQNDAVVLEFKPRKLQSGDGVVPTTLRLPPMRPEASLVKRIYDYIFAP